MYRKISIFLPFAATILFAFLLCNTLAKEVINDEKEGAVGQALPLLPGEAEYLQAMQNIHEDGNFSAAIEQLHAGAEKGYAGAMSLLATLYAYGVGVDQSEAKAVMYHHFAAMSGNVESALALSYRHEFGVGVPVSCPLAVKYAEMGASTVVKNFHTDIRALMDMSRLDGEQNPTTIPGGDIIQESQLMEVHTFRADRGNAASMMVVGYAFMFGSRGFPQNGQLALQYFFRAMEAGEAAAYGAIGQIYAQGMSTANPPIEKNLEKAMAYFKKGAELNHPVALNGLGYIYARGEIVPRDFSLAAKYFRESAKQNNAEGAYNLGVLQLRGKGIPRDMPAASQLFAQAAQGGNILARWQLGLLVLAYKPRAESRECRAALQHFKAVNQRGIWNSRAEAGKAAFNDGDYTVSLLEYLVLAEIGVTVGNQNAAYLLKRSLGLENIDLSHVDHTTGAAKTKQEAIDTIKLVLIRRAAKEGDAYAHLFLGDNYYYGIGTPKDAGKALEHYQIAAAANVPRALFNLGLCYETGDLGVRQDFHLAKRHFDLSANTFPAADVAAKLAIVRLNFRIWIQHFRRKFGGDTWHAAFTLFPPRTKAMLEGMENYALLGLVASAVIILLVRHHGH